MQYICGVHYFNTMEKICKATTGRYLILKPLFVASQITRQANVSTPHSDLLKGILNREERKRSYVAMSFIIAL